MKSLTAKDLSLPIDPCCEDIFKIFQNHLSQRFDKPVFNTFDENELTEKISGLLGKKGQGSDKLLQILEDIVINHSMNLQNPMYMGHQVPPTLPVAAMLDLITSSMNQSMAVTRMSPVLSIMEEEVIQFLCTKIGYNTNAGGTLTSGGSVSNLIGLYGARKNFFPKSVPDNAVILCSDQSHYSVAKSAGILGFSNENVIKIESDDNYKIDIDKTIEIIDNLKLNGYKPFVISANAGSTSTGSFDDIEELSSIAQTYDMWLHIDAAHGGSLVFSDQLKHLIKGIEHADSISWDAHKMMYIPSSLGICLFKESNELKNCFKDSNAPYLYNGKETCKDLSKQSIQCTRRGDSLKLWGTLLTYGTDFFAERLEHVYDVTQYFYDKLINHQYLEPLNDPEFNIQCFRYNSGKLSEAELNEINATIRDEVNNTGELMITLTCIKNKVCMRVTIINPATTYQHIDRLIEIIETCCP
ncbi:MAG: aspartate aminotransferase family protein [Vampirovibrionia bacterium]